MLEDVPWPRAILFPYSVYNPSNTPNTEMCSEDHTSTHCLRWVMYVLLGVPHHAFLFRCFIFHSVTFYLCKENVKNRKWQQNELPDSLKKCLPQELWLPFVTCRFKLQVLKLQVYSLIDLKAKHGKKPRSERQQVFFIHPGLEPPKHKGVERKPL